MAFYSPGYQQNRFQTKLKELQLGKTSAESDLLAQEQATAKTARDSASLALDSLARNSANSAASAAASGRFYGDGAAQGGQPRTVRISEAQNKLTALNEKNRLQARRGLLDKEYQQAAGLEFQKSFGGAEAAAQAKLNAPVSSRLKRDSRLMSLINAGRQKAQQTLASISAQRAAAGLT